MNENVLEQAALAWFESMGYETVRGADISPGADTPLRASYEDVVLEPLLRAALRKVNDHLAEDAIEQAVRVVTRPPRADVGAEQPVVPPAADRRHRRGVPHI